VYLAEIERRLHLGRKTAREGEEDNFQGLVFVLNDDWAFDEWLEMFCDQARIVQGVVKNLTGLCKGVADTFNHTKSFVVGEEIYFRRLLKVLGGLGFSLRSPRVS
jgi:hypothetical protein